MASLLEVVLTFVGAMLVLALVAQSLQEIIKSSVAFKSGLRFKAVRALIIESAKAVRLSADDGEDIVKALIKQLAALGQSAIRKEKSLRLDVIDADKLEALIAGLEPNDVRGLKGQPKPPATLPQVGAQAKKWFDLSVNPVTDRHGRRMKLSALVTGAVVVAVVNADAFWIMDHARNDPAFRAKVATQVDSLGVAATAVRAIEDSMNADTTASDSVFEALSARRETLVQQRFAASRSAVMGEEGLFPGYAGWTFSFRWLFGILISTLLVGLGAPFWNDVLGSLTGVKDRVQTAAKALRKDARVN